MFWHTRQNHIKFISPVFLSHIRLYLITFASLIYHMTDRILTISFCIGYAYFCLGQNPIKKKNSITNLEEVIVLEERYSTQKSGRNQHPQICIGAKYL